MLVHGYCAGKNEFPPSQFTNPVQFQDYKQARSNDAFALKIKEFADQFPAFTIVEFPWTLFIFCSSMLTHVRQQPGRSFARRAGRHSFAQLLLVQP